MPSSSSSSRKRLRNSSKPQQRKEGKHTNNDGHKKHDNNDNDSDTDDVILSPHTRRLLILIQKGTPSHAQLAALHLTEIAKRISPLLLWDLMGRLTHQLLTATADAAATSAAPTTSTRHSASWALQGVAQQIPRSDQESFLSNTKLPQLQPKQHVTTDKDNGDDDDNESVNTALWLSVETLDISAVLLHGTRLYGAPERTYDYDEPLLLLQQRQQLHDNHADHRDLLQQRIQLQRRILAKRLGLGGLLKKNIADEFLPTEISSADLVPTMTQQRAHHKHSSTKKTKASSTSSPEALVSLRALMVQHFQHQQSQKSQDVYSQQTPQQLLATEFLYRMLDPHWQVRQGALLGLQSILQAWSNTTNRNATNTTTDATLSSSTSTVSYFGAWPRDILARCICVLVLDRLNDYSCTTTTTTTTAPVRQVAAHVVALLYRMAPQSHQQACTRILLQLVVTMKKTPSAKATNDDDNIDWQVRHGAWLALLSCQVVVDSIATNRDDHDHDDDIPRAAIQTLSNDEECDDVVAVAAQYLLWWWQKQERPARLAAVLESAICKALLRIQSCVMVSAVPVVQLFARISANVGAPSHPKKKNATAATTNVYQKQLSMFLTFPSSAVQIATFQAITNMWTVSSSEFEHGEDDDDHEGNRNAAHTDTDNDETYIELIRCVFETYWERFEHIENSNTMTQLITARDVAWNQLACRSSFVSVSAMQILVTSLIHRLLEGGTASPSILQRHAACCAVAKLIMQGEDFQAYAALVIYALLHSPEASQCETACLLYRALSQEGLFLALLDCPSIHNLLSVQLPCRPMQNEESLNAAITTIIDKNAWQSRKTTDAIIQELQPLIGPPITSNPPTVAGMRIVSLLAGAMVAAHHLTSLPKLTPLIRAIMTSLKSETDAEYSNHFTCTDMVALLQLLLRVGKESIRDKVLNNVCNLVACDQKGATIAVKEVITHIVRTLSKGKSVQDLPPLWQRIKPLAIATDPSKIQSLSDALSMMMIVSQGMARGSTASLHLITSTIHSLILIACLSPDASSRTDANACIKALVKADAPLLLTQSIPLLARHLKDRVRDSVRVGACRLMHVILQDADMDVCPFVRYLLPIVMSLMTDPVEECAKEASKTFADLVRVAPLVNAATNAASISLRYMEDFDDHAESVMDHLIHGKPLPPCELPTRIRNELVQGGIHLRPYQAEGIAWLRFLQTVKLNGALCDSMGLGKTLQALVAVSLKHEEAAAAAIPRKTLVVCPSSVVGHWMAEIRKFFPTIFSPVAFVGNSSARTKLWTASWKNANIMVTSYSVLRNEIQKLQGSLWEYCILDEGHLLKNPKTATAIAARKIRCNHRLILTGTPVQNRVGELWATFDFLMPNFLGSHAHFSKSYAHPIGKGLAPGATADAIKISMDKLKHLHQQVLPFILRREKEQVLKELPPKCITDVPCELTTEQSRMYKAFCATSHAQQSIAALQSLAESEDEPTKLGSNVLKSLLYLRLLCTHPALVETTQDSVNPATQLQRSGKLQVLNELLRTAGTVPEELTAADNDASTFYLETRNETADDGYEESLEDGNDVPLVSPSAHNSTSAPTTTTKCLIFAQFTQSLDVVEKYLFDAHMPSLRYLRLDGRVPNEKRTAIVDAFNAEDKGIQVLLLTTRVGGLGLNLTGASMVVLLEHDYNPFADLQAMDRAHRIGQNKSVHVYRLISSDSVEEKIMMVQQAKIRMSNAIVNSENSSMYSMGTDRLLDIFTFQSDENAAGKRSSQSAAATATLERNALGDYDDEHHALSIEEFAKTFANK